MRPSQREPTTTEEGKERESHKQRRPFRIPGRKHFAVGTKNAQRKEVGARDAQNDEIVLSNRG